MKKLTAVVLVLLLLFSVPLADAYLGAVISLATVLRVGAIYIGQLWRNTVLKDAMVSGLAHIAAGTALWLAYDRGTSPPANERYVTVKLTNFQDAIQAEKVSHTPAQSRTYGDAVNTFPAPSGCNEPGYYAWNSNPSASYFCCKANPACPSTCYAGNNGSQFTGSICISGGYVCGVCDVSVRNNNQAIADNIINDPAALPKIQNALGKDMASGVPVLASSPPANSVVVPMGGDTYETNNYSDANNFISGGSSVPSSSLSASDIGSAVGSSVNPSLSNIKTSVDGVKTSVDGVKTSTDGVKTSVDGVKTSVDAVNTKLGTNPGSLTDPSYDSNYTNPTENSITDRIGSFISSNPIIGAISGSHMSLSGATCTASVGGSAFEKPLVLDFCWMEAYLIMFGNVMVIFAGLTAAFIIFRRGD